MRGGGGCVSPKKKGHRGYTSNAFNKLPMLLLARDITYSLLTACTSELHKTCAALYHPVDRNVSAVPRFPVMCMRK